MHPTQTLIGRVALSAAAAMLMTTGVAPGDTLTLGAERDNTLYFSGSGGLSNGSGVHLFSGLTLQNQPRRALVRFDLSSIPAGSTIESVTLRLTVSMTITGDETISAHRVAANWGEGASDATGQEGAGGPSAAGDATWFHTFFPGSFWATPGGDFAPAASATAVVGPDGPYEWTGAGLAADVQAFVDGTAENFGWILINEASPSPTAKRFDSRENPNPLVRPSLTIEFTPPVIACEGDLNGDLSVDSDDLSILLGAFGSTADGDLTGDGVTDSDDLGALLGVFGTAC